MRADDVGNDLEGLTMTKKEAQQATRGWPEVHHMSRLESGQPYWVGTTRTRRAALKRLRDDYALGWIVEAVDESECRVFWSTP